MAWAALDDEIFIGADLLGTVWLGVAGLGLAWPGMAWAALDDAIFIGADLHGGVRQGQAGRGKVWSGEAGSGLAWSGRARFGKAWTAQGSESLSVRICRVWLGPAGHGWVRRGMGRTR